MEKIRLDIDKGVIALFVPEDYMHIVKMNFTQRVVFKVENTSVVINYWEYDKQELRFYFDFY